MSAPVKKTVELFYDVISPYSWIAFEVLTRYRPKWNMDLFLRPFFLGGVFAGSQNQAPLMNAKKAMYMMHDLERLKNHYKIPIKQSEKFVEIAMNKGTLPAQRFLTALDLSQPQFVEGVSRQLWLRIWSKSLDIGKPESLAEAARTAGMPDKDIQQALSLLQDDKVKNTLKQRTEEALKYDAFGAPTILVRVGNKVEMVHGSDRIHIVADLIGEKYEGPLVDKASSHL